MERPGQRALYPARLQRSCRSLYSRLARQSTQRRRLEQQGRGAYAPRPQPRRSRCPQRSDRDGSRLYPRLEPQSRCLRGAGQSPGGPESPPSRQALGVRSAKLVPWFYFFSASMRSSATRAQYAVSSSTLTWLITSPCTSASSTQARYAGWMRYIVEQGQTTGSRQKISCSGWAFASRCTRLISVPTAHLLPAGARSICSTIYSVEPNRSAASSTSRRHSGCTSTLISGYSARAFSICSTLKRMCVEQ